MGNSVSKQNIQKIKMSTTAAQRKIIEIERKWREEGINQNINEKDGKEDIENSSINNKSESEILSFFNDFSSVSSEEKTHASVESEKIRLKKIEDWSKEPFNYLEKMRKLLGWEQKEQSIWENKKNNEKEIRLDGENGLEESKAQGNSRKRELKDKEKESENVNNPSSNIHPNPIENNTQINSGIQQPQSQIQNLHNNEYLLYNPPAPQNIYDPNYFPLQLMHPSNILIPNVYYIPQRQNLPQNFQNGNPPPVNHTQNSNNHNSRN